MEVQRDNFELASYLRIDERELGFFRPMSRVVAGAKGSANPKKGEKRMKRLLVVAASVAVLVGAAASGALAGEVKGPPGSPSTAQPGGNPNATGAPTNANSNCSYSGLNDFDSTDELGQNVRQTQTPHDVPVPGIAGHGTCAGGTNESREEKGGRPTP